MTSTHLIPYCDCRAAVFPNGAKNVLSELLMIWETVKYEERLLLGAVIMCYWQEGL